MSLIVALLLAMFIQSTQILVRSNHGISLCIQMLHARQSSKLGTDNTTACLPDVLQFCDSMSTGQQSHLSCPTLAFRRPETSVVGGTQRVSLSSSLPLN